MWKKLFAEWAILRARLAPPPAPPSAPSAPSLEPWQELVRDVSRAGGAYVQTITFPDGHTVGVGPSPIEWSLLQVGETRIEPFTATCAVTHVPLSTSTRDAEGNVDWSGYGVRCARCAAPLLITVAGVVSPLDAPSCPACREAVHAEQAKWRSQ